MQGMGTYVRVTQKPEYGYIYIRGNYLMLAVTHHSINVGNPKYGYRTTSVVAHVFVTDVTANQEIGSPLGEQYGWT